MSNYVQYDDLNTVLTEYATAIKDRIIQYSTMPIAVAKDVNRIVQYVGETNTNYTNGLFYKCIEDTTSGSSVYSWKEVSVQDVSAKADKVDNATNGHLAGLDANGNLTDSGTDPTTLQSKTLETPLTIDGTSATTVEGALGTLNTKKIDISKKGSSNGIAELDETGKVPISQLPATMSQLEKYPTRSDFPAVGGDNTLYVALDTNFTYHWTGVDYVQIDESIQLGETASTAYRGDRGKIAYDHSQITSGNPHNVTYSDVGAAPVNHTHDYLPLSGGTMTGAINGVKLGTSGSSYGYYDANGNFKSFRQPTGNATAAQVVSGYTFSNASSDSLTGTFAAQEKTVTAGTSAASVTPDSGKYLSKVTYNPTPSQTKSASPSTSAQTISPDSGKLLSSVSISAISPQRSLGTAATGSGIDGTGPYVYLPYGWYPYRSASSDPYIYMTAAQAVTACPKQEKTITSSRSAQTVTPDSGKLLSKVTVNKYPDATGTYTPSGSNLNSSAADMGATNNYRYVNTAVCYSAGRNSTANRVNFCVQGTGELWIPVKTPFTCSKFTITEVTAESGGLSSSTGTIQLANNALNSYVSTQLYIAKNYTLNRANSDFVIVHATASGYKKIWIAGYVSE